MDSIVEAALRIVDEEGGEALSMRALARRLDTGTATIYRRFENRTELVAHVVDRVFGEIDFDDEELAAMDWQRACALSARALFDAMRRHPNVAILLADQLPVGPKVFTLRERTLKLFVNAGFTPADAARIYTTVGRYVLGFATQLGVEHKSRGTDPALLMRLVQGLDMADFPMTLAIGQSLAVSIEDDFEFGLGLLIVGLERLHDSV
ncbi:TetR family transcriptional regulator [Mycobacteroides saopaulense]|uniref:TetR family transcriptional regulator n=1 Tax=Mycobacteroides saopaulense TaxID=1578165 RepID=A0A1S4VIJ3_9MYCO|nr:TetR/AcrR family transcriptional regulator [Mycobacteroides saopaulense]ALR13617.1 TetR family transcriptional regulator [Mycobacteroides saopaulense]ORB49159.1 TetR family transcriptional regulator [Mycobacteroides saopaulense]